MPISFVMGPNDRPIPVQQVRTVYKFDNQTGRLVKAELGEGLTFVSHFETCPQAGFFSGSKKR